MTNELEGLRSDVNLLKQQIKTLRAALGTVMDALDALEGRVEMIETNIKIEANVVQGDVVGGDQFTVEIPPGSRDVAIGKSE